MDTVVWSLPEEQRGGTPLLLMLHGYGSDESRMAELFASLPQGFTCAAPRAPKDISGDYGWFLLDYFLNNDFAEVVAAASGVLAWLDTVMARYHFSSVSLLGYSQGMAMATTLMRLRPQSFTAGVGLSGFVLHNELLATMEPLEPQIPFLWAYDPADLVINPDFFLLRPVAVQATAHQPRQQPDQRRRHGLPPGPRHPPGKIRTARGLCLPRKGQPLRGQEQERLLRHRRAGQRPVRLHPQPGQHL